jgi:hypothetical protein
LERHLLPNDWVHHFLDDPIGVLHRSLGELEQQPRGLKGWPDRKGALQNAFRLQQLFCAQELRRAEYLAASLKMSDALRRPTTIAVIEKMFREAWNDRHEKAMRQTDPSYGALADEIELCRAAFDRQAVEGPLRDAQRDPEWIAARKAAQEVLCEYDRQLGSDDGRPIGGT